MTCKKRKRHQIQNQEVKRSKSNIKTFTPHNITQVNPSNATIQAQPERNWKYTTDVTIRSTT